MRALILWGNDASSNLGVRALGAGTEALVRRLDHEAEIRHQGYGPGDAPVRIGSSRSQLRRLVRDTDGLVDWIRGFDLVLDTRSGDSFADIYGLPRLFTMNLMGELVKKARVPLVLTPQTIGPFATVRGQLLARRALRITDSVMARDPQSAQAAARLGRPVDLLSTDVVFAIEQQQSETTRDVIVNVSGLLWRPNPHVDHLRYREYVIELCQKLIKEGRTVSLLSHVIDSPDPDNDVPAVQEVADLLIDRGFGECEVLIPESLTDVRDQISSARLVVGARMHACLNALSLGIPAIPLSYSRKFGPLLSELGWDVGIDLREPDDTMVQRTLEMVEDPSLPERARTVRAHAQALLEPVVAQLRRVIG